MGNTTHEGTLLALWQHDSELVRPNVGDKGIQLHPYAGRKGSHNTKVTMRIQVFPDHLYSSITRVSTIMHDPESAAKDQQMQGRRQNFFEGVKSAIFSKPHLLFTNHAHFNCCVINM